MQNFFSFCWDQIKTAGYVVSTVPFVIWCILWNWAGLMLSVHLGTPILFFDMTGTAIASLSRGLGYGVFVALLSNLLPILLPHRVGEMMGIDVQVYAWFGFTNAMGALAWAVSPRVIVRRQRRVGVGFLPTNPAVGYRNLLHQIVLVGLIAGGTVTVAGIATQALALGCSPGGQFAACAEASPAVKTSYLLLRYLDLGNFGIGVTYYTVLLLFNIPDKIVATASAMMIIFTFHYVPNYTAQMNKLKQFRKHNDSLPRSFTIAWVLYFATCVGFFILYYRELFGPRDVTLGPGVIFWGAFAALALFLLRPLGMPLHSVFYQSEATHASLYHDRSLVASQSVHRDVFEDLLKTMVMLVTLANFALERVQHHARQQGSLLEPVNGRVIDLTILPTPPSPSSAQIVLTLGGPIIVLTIWRYFIVFLARYKGSLYKAAPPPAADVLVAAGPEPGPLAPAARAQGG